MGDGMKEAVATLAVCVYVIGSTVSTVFMTFVGYWAVGWPGLLGGIACAMQTLVVAPVIGRSVTRLLGRKDG